MKSAARRGGETPGRTPRRLGAPRREVVTGSSTDKKVRSAAKTPKSEDVKTPVRRSPRLALMFARSSEKKDGSEASAATKSTTKSARKSRFASQTPAKRILKTPRPIVPRAALIAKHKQVVVSAAKKKTSAKVIAASSRLLKGTQNTDSGVEKFRSRKEKLRAFEIGGRTTDYEDLTLIPAATTTTKARSPKFTNTRIKQKILTTEERELLEIEKMKTAMEKEKVRRRASSYAPPYTTIKSKVLKTLTSARASKAAAPSERAVDDAADAVRRTRSRRTSAPTMYGAIEDEQTPDLRDNKRKRISITGAVLTEIKPFNLTTERRGAYHERKFARMREDEEERENASRPRFTATPIPRNQRAGVSITRQQLASMLGRDGK